MKQFKQFYKEEQLDENIIAGILTDLAFITKDLFTISGNIISWVSKKGFNKLKDRYNKQAIADRKAAKALKQANKLEKLRIAKVQYLKQQERIEREKQAIKGLDAKVKADNKAQLQKTMKKLENASKLIDKNLGKLDKQGV
jgi:hypothetical protein